MLRNPISMCSGGGGDGDWCKSVAGSGHDREAVEQLSRDDEYSMSAGILPSLGGKTSRRVKLRRFIICPFDYRYRSLPSSHPHGWDMVLLLFSHRLESITIPLEFHVWGA